MKKEKILPALLLFVFLLSLNAVFVSAVLNLKITGSINNYTSDVRLKTNSVSSSGLDVYDMFVRDNPSDYSSFYSSLTTGDSLAIDSWQSNPRTLDLVYSMSPAQTGALTFSWASLEGGDYDATFYDYYDDSTYSAQVGSADMRASSSYTTNISGESDIYIKVVVSDHPGAVTPAAGVAGGGGAAEIKIEEIEVAPKFLDVPIVINTVKTRKISVYNKGTVSVDVFIAVKELENIVLIEEKDKSFKLASGERKTIDVRIAAPEKAGIYTGKILISGQEVLVNLNVNTKELLFDIGIVIPEEFKTLSAGERLKAQVTLIPMGEEPRVDTTLSYVIKNFEGRTFLSESETILVDKQKSFMKEFSTENLPPDSYILGLEVTYLDSVATSSDHFEVAEAALPLLANYKLILFLLLIGILILLILIILMIKRHKKLRKYAKLKK